MSQNSILWIRPTIVCDIVELSSTINYISNANSCISLLNNKSKNINYLLPLIC